MNALDVETVIRTAVLAMMREDKDIDPEDLYQEAQAWASEHSSQVDYYCAMRHPATASMFMRRDIVRRLRAYARREKAFREGFEPADVFTYSATAIEIRGLIAECLKAIITGTREPSKMERIGPSNADPAESSNNFLVAMLDVERGWGLLEDEDKKLLAGFFVYGVNVLQLAEESGVSEKHVYSMLKAALKRLVGPLNGVAA